MAGRWDRTKRRVKAVARFSRPMNQDKLVQGKKGAYTGEQLRADLRVISKEAKITKGKLVEVNGETMAFGEFNRRVNSGEIRTGAKSGAHGIRIFDASKGKKGVVLSRRK